MQIAGILNDFWRFNLNTRKWTFLGGSQQQENAGSMTTPLWPSARRDTQLVFDDSRKALFMVGGFGYGKPVDNTANFERAFVTSVVDPNNLAYGTGGNVYGDNTFAFDGFDATYSNSAVGGPIVYLLSVTLEPTAPLPITRIRFYPGTDGTHSPTSLNIWTNSTKLVQLLSVSTTIAADTTYTLATPYYGRTFYFEIGKATTWQVYLYEVQFMTNRFKGITQSRFSYQGFN